MQNKNFPTNEFGRMRLDSLIGFDAYGGVFQRIFPVSVLSTYSTIELLGMVTHFCESLDLHAPAVCFSIPEFGEYNVLLKQLPNRLIEDISAQADDPKGIYVEWNRRVLRGEKDMTSQYLTPDSSEATKPGNRITFYPPSIVPCLGHFCAIQRSDGSICADLPVFNSVYCGQRVLHGLVDMHVWSQIRGFVRLPEPYATQEAEKLRLYDKRGRMEPIFDLFTTFRGQTVAVKIGTEDNQTRDLYGYIRPQETPSGTFEIGDIETTYNRVVFMARAQEIDTLIRREHITRR